MIKNVFKISSGAGIFAEAVGEVFRATSSTLTLRELCERYPAFFLPESKGFMLLHQNKPFANERSDGRVLRFRSAAASGSFNKTWGEQLNLLSGGEFVPTTRDLVGSMIAYFQETGKKLFTHYWVRTSDFTTASGCQVFVKFTDNGIFLCHAAGEYRWEFLGLAVAEEDV